MRLSTGHMMNDAPVPRLAIDCSSTRQCNFNSGIQRVVRSLCGQIPIAPADSFLTSAVFGCNGNWYQAQSLWPEPTLCDNSSPQLKKKGLHHKLFRELHRFVRKLKLRKSQADASHTLLDLGLGDVLLMADASWMQPNWEAVEQAKSSGAKIGLLIYDIIPIINPELFQHELVDRFQSWFTRAITTADFIVCISHAVADSVRQELQHRRIHSDLISRIYAFPLGSEIRSSVHLGPPSPVVAQRFTEERTNNPCLMVGTLEPRKNHNFVLDAFERLWKRNGAQSLYIMGRIGWNCTALVERIRQHPEYGTRLFLNTEATDEDVHHAYQHARAVIMASKNEGYGLPIVEGLSYQQIVLASDIPVHREVGKDRAHYFRIDQGTMPLETLLTNLETISAESRSRLALDATSENISWLDSYNSLCNTIVAAISVNSDASSPAADHSTTHAA